MDTTVAVATSAQADLLEHGYVVLEGLISADELTRLQACLEGLMARERAEPFEPGDGPAYAEEEEHATRYAQKAWARQSAAENERLRRRLRHTRAENFDTPWPVGIAEVCGCFRHFPTLYDDDRSQRVFNLINKLPEFAVLIEHPVMLALMSALLGRDCILLDVSASSVGPDTARRWPAHRFADHVHGRAAARPDAQYPSRVDADGLHDREWRQPCGARHSSLSTQAGPAAPG